MSLLTMAFAKDFQNSTKTVSVFAYYFRVGPFNDMGGNIICSTTNAEKWIENLYILISFILL